MTQPAFMAEELPVIEFSIAGAPIPQGSKSVAMRGGKPVLMDQQDMKTKTQPAGRLKAWKALIADKATREMSDFEYWEVWSGPIMLECVFVMPRSPSHFTGKGALKKGAPMVPQKDLDKLIRAVGDALSKVVYRDDVQIISFGASTKRFAKSRDAIGGVYVKVSCL